MEGSLQISHAYKTLFSSKVLKIKVYNNKGYSENMKNYSFV